MGVLTTSDHVLVNDVVVGFADMRVRHILELGQTLELVRSDEVVVLLAGKNFEDGLGLGVEVQFIVVSIVIWQY